jgi:hypothetical protein
MLGVMTFNVGIFCAVIGGVVAGELFFRRFAQPSSWRQDGECHN